MTDYLTEQEQVELLKNWIKQYSLFILAGIIIASIAIVSWRYWQQYQIKKLSHASAVYDEMLTMRAQNDANGTLVQARKLFRHYTNTVYGQMAELMLARDAVLKENFLAAEKSLNSVLKKSKIPALRQIAKLRLARILIAEHKPEASITLLKKVEDKYFDGLTYEIRGDAYVAMHNITMAKASYQKALKNLPNAEVIRPLLRMKYDNLSTFPVSKS